MHGGVKDPPSVEIPLLPFEAAYTAVSRNPISIPSTSLILNPVKIMPVTVCTQIVRCRLSVAPSPSTTYSLRTDEPSIGG